MRGKGSIVPRLCPICRHTGGQVWHVNPRTTRVPESFHSIFSSPWIGAGARGFRRCRHRRLATGFPAVARAVCPFLRSVLRRKHSLLHVALGCEHVAFLVTLDFGQTFLHDTKDQAPIATNSDPTCGAYISSGMITSGRGCAKSVQTTKLVRCRENLIALAL